MTLIPCMLHVNPKILAQCHHMPHTKIELSCKTTNRKSFPMPIQPRHTPPCASPVMAVGWHSSAADWPIIFVKVKTHNVIFLTLVDSQTMILEHKNHWPMCLQRQSLGQLNRMCNHQIHRRSIFRPPWIQQATYLEIIQAI